MKRSEFLKRLGIGTAAVIVAPQILKALPKKSNNEFEPTGLCLSPDDLKIINQVNYNAKKISAAFNVSPEFLQDNIYYQNIYQDGKLKYSFRLS